MPSMLLLMSWGFLSIGALKIQVNPDRLWSEEKIVQYMNAHPQRAFFSQLFTDGGFRTGMEVGVAAGRFSELFLKKMSSVKSKNFTWHLVEPFPNTALASRYPDVRLGVGPHGAKRDIARMTKQEAEDTWANRGMIENVDIKYHKNYSTDEKFLAVVPDHSLDFVYLDGAHDYANVKKELETIKVKMSPGAVLAGHDYCNYGEPALACSGCDNVPLCGAYTEFALKKGVQTRADNQAGVVQAVQEFAQANPDFHLHHTIEDFTRESLAKDGLDYDEVITGTRNPSWFFVLSK